MATSSTWSPLTCFRVLSTSGFSTLLETRLPESRITPSGDCRFAWPYEYYLTLLFLFDFQRNGHKVSIFKNTQEIGLLNSFKCWGTTRQDMRNGAAFEIIIYHLWFTLLTSVPLCFIYLFSQRLQELHLQENSIELLAEHALSGLSSLALLDLSKNHLRTLGASFLKPLVSLQVLRVTGRWNLRYLTLKTLWVKKKKKKLLRSVQLVLPSTPVERTEINLPFLHNQP